MSVLHTAFLIFALMWSWCTFKPGVGISDIEHSEIQFQVKEFITDYIKENNPNASNISFKKLWSEPVGEEQVNVHFSYSIKETSEDDLSANVNLSGKITLKKTMPAAPQEPNQWNMEALSLEDENIEFNQPLLVTPESENDSNN